MFQVECSISHRLLQVDLYIKLPSVSPSMVNHNMDNHSTVSRNTVSRNVDSLSMDNLSMVSRNMDSLSTVVINHLLRLSLCQLLMVAGHRLPRNHLNEVIIK